MKTFRFLALFALVAVALPARAQDIGSGAGAALSNGRFSASLGVAQGQKFNFDGATGAKYLSSDGTTLTLTGLNFSPAAGKKTCFGPTCTAYIDGPDGTGTLNLYTNGWGFVVNAQAIATSGFSASAGNPSFTNNSGVPLRITTSNALLLTSSTGGLCVGNGSGDECDGTITHAADVATVQTLTVADNANGGTPATATLTPTSRYVNCTCNDAQGCTITMGESSIADGTVVTIVTSTANVCTFADTSGVSELSGAISLGQWDSLELLYVTDRWVQLATTNN